MTPSPGLPTPHPLPDLSPQLERLAAVFGRSSRKREICELLSHGLRNKQIAAALRMSTGTVDTHLKQVYSALNIQDRALLARLTTLVLLRQGEISR